MKILVPFVLSGLIPGTGQLYIGKYWQGALYILAPILLIFIVPISPYYPFYISVIISLADLYFTFEKTEGKRKALNNLIFGILTVIVIIPALFWLLTLSIFKGGEYMKQEFLNEKYTKEEMSEIAEALKKYKLDTDSFPNNYQRFVSSKPIWDSWSKDYWGTAYSYILEGDDFTLISAGKDLQLGTQDDIKFTSIYQ